MGLDIRISTSFKGHRKRRKLSRLLGEDSTGYVIDLWITACQTRPRGVLVDWDHIDIAEAAGYSGDADKFVEALVKAGFLENSDNGHFALHDWRAYQGYVFYREQRQHKARRAAAARYSKKWKKAGKVLVGCSNCDAEAPDDVMCLDENGVCIYCRRDG